MSGFAFLLIADGHPALSLMGSCFDQIVARKYYDASCAGLHYDFSVHRK
jgi:hypothetical protein